jgi:predicted NBD/HSP70 family sugar kinase
MAAWRDHDIGADLAAATGLPVLVENDGSAACAAELMFGTGRLPNCFAYFYVGHFVGGAVVLGGQVFTGRTGNAGAFGSMPVGLANGATRQLIDVASLRGLESALLTVGAPSSQLWTSPETWTVDAGVLSGWLDRAAAGIAQATAAAACILDMDLAIIDGWFPAEVRADLVARTGAALALIDMAGATRPAVSAGSIGPAARSLGAASLPISARYLIEPSMRMA